MSRINHIKGQPMSIHFWDYAVICGMDTDAALVLQRMEYWDGTKEDGNVHAENINDTREKHGLDATQDTSEWIYKTGDELQWELGGQIGEKKVRSALNMLVNDLHFLAQRSNPDISFDRTQQYQLNAKAIQQRLDYLAYIINYFDLPMRRLNPVYHTIGVLINEGMTVETLTIESVVNKLKELEVNPKLPVFLKKSFQKFSKTMAKTGYRPCSNFATSMDRFCTMQGANMLRGEGENADAIPESTTATTSKTTERKNASPPAKPESEEKPSFTPSLEISFLDELNTEFSIRRMNSDQGYHAQLKALSEDGIKTREDWIELVDQALKEVQAIPGSDQTLSTGNLVKALKAWKQQRARKKRTEAASHETSQQQPDRGEYDVAAQEARSDARKAARRAEMEAKLACEKETFNDAGTIEKSASDLAARKARIAEKNKLAAMQRAVVV